MNGRALTEQEFGEWLQHPGTIALKEILEKKREELRQRWEGGSFTDYEKDGTVLVNVGNMGTCKGYAFVTDFNYEAYVTELEDAEEPIGARSSGSSGTG